MWHHREVSLPNGYILYVDDFSWIEHPSQTAKAVHDVGELDIQGDIVFGTRWDSWDEEFLGYFILDTQLQVVWYTRDENEWVEKLNEMGIKEPKVRWPGLFFNGYPLWLLVILMSILLPVILLTIWILRQFILEERQLYQDRFDRL
ncbi:MAG: hypothetical protein R3B67_02750 [Phycisphaerales bacterium]